MEIAHRSGKAQHRFAAVSDPQKVASLSAPTAESVTDICHPSSHQSGCPGVLKGTPSQTLWNLKTKNAIERKSGEEAAKFSVYQVPVGAHALRVHILPVLRVLVSSSNVLRKLLVW